MRRGLGSALLVCVCLHAASARGATESERRAAESFRQAQAAFGRRDYAAAAAAFEKAAEFDPHPAPLLNAAQAWELAKDYVRAAEDCDRVLALPNVADEFAKGAREELERVKSKVATLDLEGPRTIAARLDGGAEFRLPARRRMTPGKHELVAVDVATSAQKTIALDIAEGQSRTLDLTPPPEAPKPSPVVVAPPAQKPPPPPPNRTGLWVSLGATAVATGAAVVFGVMTAGAKDDYDARPTQNTKSAFYRNVAFTDVAIGVALAGAVASVVFWRLGRHPSTSATLAVAPTIDGGALRTTVHF